MKKLYVSLIMSAMLFMSFVPVTDSSWNAEKRLIENTLDPESIEQGSWGDWTQTNCFRHLDFRVKNRGKIMTEPSTSGEFSSETATTKKFISAMKGMIVALPTQKQQTEWM